MAGIISYGAYVPLWRLTREAILKGLRGEKAIRNFDEDSTTMAVSFLRVDHISVPRKADRNLDSGGCRSADGYHDGGLRRLLEIGHLCP